MKYFLIAGERSGDMHGSNLVHELKKVDQIGRFVGFGGDLMENAGMTLLSNYRNSSYMGFLEVLKNLRKIGKQLNKCKKAIANEKPDVIILIDYSGFNLKIAKYAKKSNLKVAYYIAPKLWAWGKHRARLMKRVVDATYVIFPFERDFFTSLGLKVHYVGNPLLDAINKHEFKVLEESTSKKYNSKIAFLPGSRVQEVQASVEVIKALAAARPDSQIFVAGVANIDGAMYESIEGADNIKVFTDRTYDILNSADVAIVTSGTATLEAALLRVPQVVCYRTSWFSYILAKNLVKLTYISLVNLISKKEIVRELIQGEYTLANVLQEIDRLLQDNSYSSRMLEEYDHLKRLIGEKSASNEVANLLYSQFHQGQD